MEDPTKMKILFGINLLQFQMIKTIVFELIHFSIILVLLALVQHQDLLDSPLLRFEQMQMNGNFLHPFLWTLGVYLIIGIFRLIIKGLMKFKNRK